MIFLTVGHELGFDRLVRAVDDWCHNRDRSDVFGQIGNSGDQRYRPSHFEWADFVATDEYERRYQRADFIVAHAGMGSIISALTLAKPILIMPRRGSLKETRNDHQFATADRFATRSGVYVAADETKIGPMLDRLSDNVMCLDVEAASQFAAPRLIATIHDFIHNYNKC